MIGIDFIYTALGCFSVYAGARSLCAGLTLRSILESTFWTLYGLNFLLGNLLSDFLNGVLVLLLTTLATGMVRRSKPRPSTTSTGTVRATPPIRLPTDDADTRRSPLLFVPLLTVPLFVVILTWWGTSIHWGSQPLIDPQRLSQVAYVIAVMAGLGWLVPSSAHVPLHHSTKAYGCPVRLVGQCFFPKCWRHSAAFTWPQV